MSKLKPKSGKKVNKPDALQLPKKKNKKKKKKKKKPLSSFKKTAKMLIGRLPDDLAPSQCVFRIHGVKYISP